MAISPADLIHYHVHFTPTTVSWTNQTKRWFAELARKAARLQPNFQALQMDQINRPKPGCGVALLPQNAADIMQL
jgi:hypothetical protein